MISYPRVLPVGDTAFTVEFGAAIEEGLVAQVQALDAALAAAPLPGIRETAPSYRALLIVYDPRITPPPTMHASLMEAAMQATATALPEGRLVEIPVRYGGADGPDLEAVAREHRITQEEVIARHTAPTYRVAMLGFAPGFAYLLGLDPRLATPRLATPRTRIPPGSVGIAGDQSGVYALSTPGGWRIIGRTPLTLFDPAHPQPFILQPGDRVRFTSTHAEPLMR